MPDWRRPRAGPGRRGRLQTGDRTIAKNLRCNEQIRISPIRLIDEADNQIGIIDVREAMQRAQQAGMDLVEVAPDARPPVCRIMDYGKWKYAQSKKEQKSKAHRKETELKEIRIKTPKIGGHDLQIKVGRAREFLTRGDRVQFLLRFRGRELAHIDEGEKVFQQIKEQLSDVSKIDQDWRREGRRITMTLAPGVTKAAPRAADPATPRAVEPPAPRAAVPPVEPESASPAPPVGPEMAPQAPPVGPEMAPPAPAQAPAQDAPQAQP